MPWLYSRRSDGASLQRERLRLQQEPFFINLFAKCPISIISFNGAKRMGLGFMDLMLMGQSFMVHGLKGPIGLIIGSGRKGPSRLARERCDGLIKIPMF